MDERDEMSSRTRRTRLHWVQVSDSLHTYRAETPLHRFVIVAPPRSAATLWAQLAVHDWGTEPIDERSCRTRRGAERMAQRFANKRLTSGKLR